MLRIHFTLADVARTRLAGAVDPMWEIVLSIQLLQNREGAVVFDGWRRFARERIDGSGRHLAVLAPHAAYFPDFLTPPESAPSLDAGIDLVLATSRRRLRAELALLFATRPVPGWLRRLADADRETLTGLGAAFRGYFGTCLRPLWATIQERIDADRSVRLNAMATGGCEALLASFRPLLRWRAPVLEADYPVDQELHLDGRGLLLVPAFFCWRTPVTLVDPRLRPVLIYPIAHDLSAAGPGLGAADGLAGLLGHNRATVLRAVGHGGTTSELARRARTSVASASRHAAVLREAGLLVSQRDGGRVLHSLTPLGAALLDRAPTPLQLPANPYR